MVSNPPFEPTPPAESAAEQDIDARCNAIIEEAMRRVSTVRGEQQLYAVAYSADNKTAALHYLSNAGRRGALALLNDCRRGLISQNRRLDS